MTNFSELDQFELAEAKIQNFITYLNTLKADRKKLKEEIDRGKRLYYDVQPPQFQWGNFRKYLFDQCLIATNPSLLVPLMTDIKRIADECISLYCLLLRKSEQEVHDFFQNPSKNKKTTGISFRNEDIGFCVKASSFINQMLPQLAHLSSVEVVKSLEDFHSGISGVSGNSKPQLNDKIDEDSVKANEKSDQDIIFRGDRALAEYLGCSLTTIVKRRNEKLLPHYRIGNIILYKKKEVDEALSSHNKIKKRR